MKSFKPILSKFIEGFPYLFYSSICFYFFSRHFTIPGYEVEWWSAILMLTLALLFLFQLRFQIRYLNSILGIITICWSIWMSLAALTDLAKAEAWTSKSIQFSIIVLIILTVSYYSAIKILNKKKVKRANEFLT